MKVDGTSVADFYDRDELHLVEQMNALRQALVRTDLEEGEQLWIQAALNNVAEQYWDLPRNRVIRDQTIQLFGLDPARHMKRIESGEDDSLALGDW